MIAAINAGYIQAAAHTCTLKTHSVTPRHPKPSVTRAGGCSAPALMEGLTSAILSYFHPPKIVRQPGEKKPGEKLRGQEHEIQLFLCKPLIHFILLPNLQSPGNNYPEMRKWAEKGSEAC